MQEQSIFVAALEKEDPTERAAYLDGACAGDVPLRQRIERLLRAHQEPASFLEPPAPAVTVDEPRGADATPLAEKPGTRIGPYKLLEQIGEGGMGLVFVAEQQHPVRRKVAVKVIKPGMDSAQVLARFEAERQALALMDHPHIAKVFDAGATDTGRPYFVMELVRGVPATEFCDKNHLPAAQRLGLFVTVCHAIQHAHHKGVIHRDIKPSNVMVTLHDGVPVVKVIDFGIAKATSQKLTERTLFTAYGHMIGTPQYMSPEQAEMSGLDVDTRSDVYSLGVLLYELLTGTTPLEAQTLRKAGYAEMRRLICEEEPPRPSHRISTLGDRATVVARDRQCDPRQLRRQLRGDLDWIVLKALEKDRARRYESASNFAADVQRYLADQPVHACPPSFFYRLRKFVRRQRAAVFGTVCLAALAATVAAGAWLYRGVAKEAEDERQAAELARRTQEAHEKLPLVQEAVRKGHHERAFELLTEIEPLLAGHQALPELWEQCAQTCSVATTPSDANVWRRPYAQPDAPWQHVIHTKDRPTEVRVPRGEYLWRVTKAGYREVVGLRLPQQTWFTLDPEDAIPAEMVRVPKGRPNRLGLAFTVAFQPVDLPAFLIDRYEVTNAQYEQFVQAGGYAKPVYWHELPFVDATGQVTTWEAVRPLLVDQAGRPGPATWRQGVFPPGEAQHPVRGVSWYEAMAYARFAGKSLPTMYHWAQASQIESSVVG